MNQIEVFNETNEKIEIDFLKELMEFSVKKENVEHVIFNVVLVDNETIHKMNLEYRGMDRVTDVISFALEDDKTCLSFEGNPRVLGDIYISVPKAKTQAEEYEHSFKRELSFLAVHGLLHLLGYDHMEESEEKIMFARQELILSEFGITR